VLRLQLWMFRVAIVVTGVVEWDYVQWMRRPSLQPFHPKCSESYMARQIGSRRTCLVETRRVPQMQHRTSMLHFGTNWTGPACRIRSQIGRSDRGAHARNLATTSGCSGHVATNEWLVNSARMDDLLTPHESGRQRIYCSPTTYEKINCANSFVLICLWI
jgi:hypothetical protein